MNHTGVQAIVWQNNSLQLLDQRYLPAQRMSIDCSTAADVAEAITQMVVRGAPAIGITAAYGVVLAAQHRHAEQADLWREQIITDIKLLAASRPTAVNLFWALRRMQELIEKGAGLAELEAEAISIHREDLAANLAMGDLGAALMEPGKAVLTHCNTGSLATGGYGTALGVIRSAHKYGKVERIYADETRPWLQGSRLTAWELAEDGIDCTLIAEGAAASLLSTGRVGWVIVGADRIAANGDVANKIGTYSLAVLARHHGVKFMVVAPSSTLDLQTANGAGIAIEERPAGELVAAAGYGVLPVGISAWNPVFDMTPAKLIDAIVTERGVVSPPTQAGIAALLA